MNNVAKLTISLVVYKPDLNQLNDTLTSLATSLDYAGSSYHIYIIDNTPQGVESGISTEYISRYFKYDEVTYSRNEKNVGFGGAHNQALDVQSDFHLIINPDLIISRDAISNAMLFMSSNERCGLVTPYATWTDGTIQRLCKQYPSVLVLLLRGFAPPFIKKPFNKLLNNYEMVGVINCDEVFWNPPMVSGCFMFFKTEVWKKCRGFDHRYFLYFEDFDLSIRAKQVCDIAYVPSVKVVHHGGYAARKGLKHIVLFFKSMVSFFRIHHWRWF
ncbi:glycosyltransferase family 2 protein [Lelliottia sp. RWM.1]|uniref:glycosyltransferase family 2 protein n=1 Tax=Lelliottia sp. RWM.1 TaxID=2663242 RepID=UPI00193D66EF|nr:glycosyltransferase family 2 protein [Lelliottia sp. RWM.1]MBM3071000.1 glycosyltransferase [Lelliottia sp. RWM.1]